MTTLAILSDIHGNLPALEAVLKDMAQYRVDQVIVAGDSILGPFSEQVVEYIVEKSWMVIQGNYESYLLNYDNPRTITEWGNTFEYPIPAWLNHLMSVSMKAVIALWPDVLHLKYQDALPLLISHGSPRNKWESIYPTLSDGEIEAIFASVDENIVITGHTHLILDRRVNRWHIYNPGSVGAPLDGLMAASYILLKDDEDGWQSVFRRAAFDVGPLLREFERQGFIETCGVVGSLLFESFKTARPQGGFLCWRKEHYPDVPLSQEMLNEYLSTCKWWEYTHPAYRVNMRNNIPYNKAG